jgi:hypothetical protein
VGESEGIGEDIDSDEPSSGNVDASICGQAFRTSALFFAQPGLPQRKDTSCIVDGSAVSLMIQQVGTLGTE